MADHGQRGEVNSGYVIEETISPPDYNSTEPYKTEFGIDESAGIAEYANRPSHRQKIKNSAKTTLKYLTHIVVGTYFGFATYHYIDVENKKCSSESGASRDPLCDIQFCNGYGLLLLLTVFVYFGLFYYQVFKPLIGRRLSKRFITPFYNWWMAFSRTRIVSTILICLLGIGVAIFVLFETQDDRRKLVSLTAPIFFILCGYLFSTNRRAIKWRLVITGITCQFILGVLCIRWEVGRKIFECFGNKVAAFLAFTDDGSIFVYGKNIINDGVFAFAILSVIFFFSFFISILYYLGTMQWVVMKLGWMLQQALGTTVCESVTAAANIFLGMSESPLLIRPYIDVLTASEIHSIMVSGFATVSGTVLAAYLSFGASAAHLITSSVMAAPATLAISKLYMPETEESQTTSDNIKLEQSEDSSILDAASNGARNAVPIVMGIIANIIAFVAFIAFVNAVVRWLGFLVGLDDIDFEWLFAKLFIPLAWAMGVSWEDCNIVAKVIATKTIINEFVAYERLGEYIHNSNISARSAGICTFAICGFANPSSLGILIGSLSVMAPNRRGLITSVAIRAFFVGSIVCFISASFAGILMQEQEESRIHEKMLSTLARKNITSEYLT